MLVGDGVKAIGFSNIRRCFSIFINNNNTHCDYDCTARYEKQALAKYVRIMF